MFRVVRYHVAKPPAVISLHRWWVIAATKCMILNIFSGGWVGYTVEQNEK